MSALLYCRYCRKYHVWGEHDSEERRALTALNEVRRVLKEAKAIKHSLPPVFSEIHTILELFDEIPHRES